MFEFLVQKLGKLMSLLNHILQISSKISPNFGEILKKNLNDSSSSRQILDITYFIIFLVHAKRLKSLRTKKMTNLHASSTWVMLIKVVVARSSLHCIVWKFHVLGGLN